MTSDTVHAAPRRTEAASRGAPPRRRGRRLGTCRSRSRSSCPATLGFVVFYVWPTLRGIYLSFTELQPAARRRSSSGWTTTAACSRTTSSGTRCRSTVYYVVINIGVQTVVGPGHRRADAPADQVARSLRGVMLLPYLVANVVAALVWLWMLDAQLGIVNQFLELASASTGIAFFGDADWAIPTIAAGQRLAAHGLHGPADLRRAADDPDAPSTRPAAMDGASEWQMFRRITLPLLRPVLALVLIITVIGSFQVFDTVAVTTEGGPANATSVIQLLHLRAGVRPLPLRLRLRDVGGAVRSSSSWSPSLQFRLAARPTSPTSS